MTFYIVGAALILLALGLLPRIMHDFGLTLRADYGWSSFGLGWMFVRQPGGFLLVLTLGPLDLSWER